MEHRVVMLQLCTSLSYPLNVLLNPTDQLSSHSLGLFLLKQCCLLHLNLVKLKIHVIKRPRVNSLSKLLKPCTYCLQDMESLLLGSQHHEKEMELNMKIKWKRSYICFQWHIRYVGLSV